MKKIFIFTVLIFSLSVLVLFPSLRTGVNSDSEVNLEPLSGEIYSGKAGDILFVEDPGMSGFGPATKPDPQWVSWLDMTLDSGNYDWWGPIVDSGDGPPVDTMLLYPLVIWNCYDCWLTDIAPTPTAVTNIGNYINQGGKFWFIGHDIIYSSSSAVTLLQTSFGLSSYVVDYETGIEVVTLDGQAEIAGNTWINTCDFQSNGFWPDDLTPGTGAHVIVMDGSYKPGIILDNYNTSFWAIDPGRIVGPQSTWIAVLNKMLNLFGNVSVEETPINIGSGFVVREINSFTSNPGIFLSSSEVVDVKVEIFDVTGRSCAVLFNGSFQGERVFSYSTTSSGTYIYRITANESVVTGKLISAY